MAFVYVVVCTSSLMALAPASGASVDHPSRLMSGLPFVVAQMLTNFVNDMDASRLTQASRNLTLCAYSRAALRVRRQWGTLFQPEATTDTLLTFFDNYGQAMQRLRDDFQAGERAARAYLLGEWARRRLRDQVPLRPQILLLRDLFNVDESVAPERFRDMLKTMAVDWRLATGYALGVAIGHTSGQFDHPHRERALGALRLLLQEGISFVDAERIGEYAAFASERMARRTRVFQYTARYDESDQITSAMLRLLPDDAHRNIARMALTGRGIDELVDEFERDPAHVDADGRLLKVLVAHGMDIDGLWTSGHWHPDFVVNPDDDHSDMRLMAILLLRNDFRNANLMVELGADFDIVFTFGQPDQYAGSNDEVLAFAEQLMRYCTAVETTTTVAWLVHKAESWRRRLTQYASDDKPVLFETCLGAVRRRFRAAGFNERFWRHEVFVSTLQMAYFSIPVRRLLGIVDDDTVLLGGIGVSILAYCNLCTADDPVSLLERLARNATDEQVQAAVTYVDEEDTHTILHTDCMTTAVLQWILRRAPVDRIWRELQRRSQNNCNDQSCIDFWMPADRPAIPDFLSVVRLLAAANGSVSSYEVAMLACGGAPRVKVRLLSNPISTALILEHLAHPDRSNDGPHAALLRAKVGVGDPAIQALNVTDARFLRHRYDGFSAIHWGVMMRRRPVVEALTAHAQHRGTLIELVMHDDLAANWTILHTVATVIRSTLSVVRAFKNQPTVASFWVTRLRGDVGMAMWIVSLLCDRIRSRDDFCELVNARDGQFSNTFLEMLDAGHLVGEHDNMFVDEIVRRVDQIATFIRRYCSA
ncbi:Uncharacterized protein PBTT_06280 [Plasmodiophora brassicae]